MRIIGVLFLFLLSTVVYAQNPNLIWSGKIGSTQDDFGRFILAKDSSVLTIGGFRGQIDLDPGNGTYIQNQTGISAIYIAQLDAAGDLEWGKTIIGSGWVNPYAMRLDNSGSIIIAGLFNGVMDFDPGSGVQNLTTTSTQEAFVLKLDNNGNFVWVAQFASNNFLYLNDAIIDNNDNVIIAGSFMGTCDFNPGSGTNSLTSASMFNGYIVKLDAGGNFVWVDQFNSSNYSSCDYMAANSSGEIALAGSGNGTVDLNPGAGIDTVTGSNFDFVCKLSSSGQLVWRDVWDMSGEFIATQAAADGNDNFIFTGAIMDTVDLDPGAAQQIVVADSFDVYLLKLDGNGNYIFGRVFGSSGEDIAFGLTIDASNRILLSGYFTGMVDMDPGLSASYLTSSSGTKDGFVSQFSSSGILLSTFQVGGIQDDAVASADYLNDSTLLITGAFRGSGDFQPGAPVIGENSTGLGDAFVCSYNLLTGFSTVLKPIQFTVFPNPVSEMCVIEGFTEPCTVWITDATGKMVREYSVDTMHSSLDVHDLPQGVYTVHVSSTKSSGRQQLIITR